MDVEVFAGGDVVAAPNSMAVFVGGRAVQETSNFDFDFTASGSGGYMQHLIYSVNRIPPLFQHLEPRINSLIKSLQLSCGQPHPLTADSALQPKEAGRGDNI